MTSTTLFSPLIPGVNPDPSVVRVGEDYYLVTSTFEYLPGLALHHSRDFEHWTQIGNVGTRPEQLGIGDVPTHLGVYAPTIRHRDGVFYVVVTIFGGRGCVVFTAEDPAGRWSDGTVIDGLQGIDPDLAWDDDGTAYVTYSGRVPTAEGDLRGAILQVSVDLATGAILDEPRELWSGTGLKAPEAPHLYQRGDAWYLMIAEGGTERGHAVSIARSDSPRGPFEGCPANPVLSARSTSRAIQCTGHADLVELPDGGDAMVLLGMRPIGMTQAYSILGRETFATRFDWVDGWPVVEPVAALPRSAGSVFQDDFSTRDLDPGWVGVRRTPAEIAAIEDGALVLSADRGDLDGLHPAFLGRRQSGLTSEVAVEIDAAGGIGGLSIRYDEQHHVDLEVEGAPDGNRVTVRLRLSGLQQVWTAALPAGPLALRIASSPQQQVLPGDVAERMIFTAAPVADPGSAISIAEIDGRYLSAEVVVSFTGRVVGPYCSAGTASFRRFEQRGTDV